MGIVRRSRRLAFAVAAGVSVGLFGLTQAHALGAGPAAGVSAHFVLSSGGGTGVARVDLTLRRPVKAVSVRVGKNWFSCWPDGLHARCPLGKHGVDAGAITQLDVVATG